MIQTPWLWMTCIRLPPPLRERLEPRSPKPLQWLTTRLTVTMRMRMKKLLHSRNGSPPILWQKEEAELCTHTHQAFPPMQGPGNNSNGNRKYHFYCKIQNHTQEECFKRIRENKLCKDKQGRAYWPKVYINKESDTKRSNSDNKGQQQGFGSWAWWHP